MTRPASTSSPRQSVASARATAREVVAQSAARDATPGGGREEEGAQEEDIGSIVERVLQLDTK